MVISIRWWYLELTRISHIHFPACFSPLVPGTDLLAQYAATLQSNTFLLGIQQSPFCLQWPPVFVLCLLVHISDIQLHILAGSVHSYVIVWGGRATVRGPVLFIVLDQASYIPFPLFSPLLLSLSLLPQIPSLFPCLPFPISPPSLSLSLLPFPISPSSLPSPSPSSISPLLPLSSLFLFQFGILVISASCIFLSSGIWSLVRRANVVEDTRADLREKAYMYETNRAYAAVWDSLHVRVSCVCVCVCVCVCTSMCGEREDGRRVVLYVDWRKEFYFLLLWQHTNILSDHSYRIVN